MKLGLKLATSVAVCSLIVAGPALSQERPATQERLNNADSEPENWLIPFQNYSSHRYSRLDEINRENVSNLKVAFTVSLEDELRAAAVNDNQVPPLVDDGMMYVEAHSGMLYKIDVSSGDRGVILWKADAGIDPDERPRTRGVAMYEDSIVQNLTDGRVLRVDRDTGEIIWEQQIARADHPGHSGVNLQAEEFTSNPLVANGVIQVGNSRGDGGTRGWVAGVDFETGEELWRWYAVPAPDEPGGETWADDHGAWRTGGGAIWTGWSFDVAQNAFIGGTAQPVPMFDPEFRPGDNLYTNSAVSLDAATGELNWYFQYVPNESWDYDEQGVHMLIDTMFGNEERQMVVHFGRNGFVYQLDRTTGDFLGATQYVTEVTWTAGIDPETGLPVEYNPNLDLQTYIPETRWSRADAEPKTACPMLAGGTRWQPPAYNPEKGIVYVGGEDGCQTHMIMPALTLEDGGIDEQGRRVEGSRADTPLGGLVAAVDVTTTDRLLERVITPYRNKSGILATAGEVLFTAYEDGTVAALHDETLEELWSFHTGIGIKAPPITYSVDGKQYVAIIAGAIQEDHETIPNRSSGSMLYVFSL